ncbi:MAG: glycosyltransferase [Clostridia bacterium]|nr:glycosyltransferase [Clostridia bacterium]
MKGKIIVVIPSYKPETTFIDYINHLSKNVDEIIVVNDGSGENYKYIFSEIDKLENVTIISYEENKGKGYALKRGITYATDSFPLNSLIITADCDGQHTVEDVLKVCNYMGENVNALYLGSRDFSLKNVPKKSKAGNSIMRKTFKIFYGGSVYDTQTGLRGFSAKLGKEFALLKGDRFEYELNVLIYAQKSGIEIVEVPIKTVYPNNPIEHKSHFKSVKDSLTVFFMMLKNLNGYFLSSLISGLFDLGVFALFSYLILNGITPLNSLISVVVARISSSFLNYFLNCKIVFKGKEKASMLKYYALWGLHLIFSYLIVLIFGNAFKNNLVLVKILGELLLGILSYELQCNWVFRNKKRGSFFGPLASFGRWLLRLFSKRYECNVIDDGNAKVYVCRHLDMHGPLTTLKWFKFDLHPMVLDKFFDKNVAYEHLKNYTFSVRNGKTPKKFSLRALCLSRFFPKLMSSLKAVPVFRSHSKGITTFKKSLKYLVKGESIIVYPDVDYRGDYSSVSDIYDGFLFLSELYKKKTGETLNFVPLFIDDESRKIIKREPVLIKDFNLEFGRAKSEIILRINDEKRFNVAKDIFNEEIDLNSKVLKNST